MLKATLIVFLPFMLSCANQPITTPPAQKTTMKNVHIFDASIVKKFHYTHQSTLKNELVKYANESKSDIDTSALNRALTKPFDKEYVEIHGSLLTYVVEYHIQIEGPFGGPLSGSYWRYTYSITNDIVYKNEFQHGTWIQ